MDAAADDPTGESFEESFEGPFDDRVGHRAEDLAADPMQAALTSLGISAKASNLARAERIDEALSHLEAGSLSADRQEVAMRSAHQLAGSAGTFGLRPASRLASWFERFFAAIDISPGSPDPRLAMNGDLATARNRLSELRSRLNDPPDLS